MVMLACKGFEPGLVATHGSGEYKYHPGLNTTEKAFCAQTGFHCAENPLECFNWYPWDGKNEFWLVEPKGDIDDDGKNISAAGKLGDYILFINMFMKGMAASTIIHIDGKKYMPDTMYTIDRDGKVYEKE